MVHLKLGRSHWHTDAHINDRLRPASRRVFVALCSKKRHKLPRNVTPLDRFALWPQVTPAKRREHGRDSHGGGVCGTS